MIFIVLMAFGACVQDGSKKTESVSEVVQKTTYKCLGSDVFPAVGQTLSLAKDNTDIADEVESTHLVSKLMIFLEDYIKFSNANDQTGIKDMLLKGHAFVVKGPCKIKILDVKKHPISGFHFVEIRVLEGSKEQLDKTGWVVKGMICEHNTTKVTVKRPLTEREKSLKASNADAAKLKAASEAEEKAADLLKHAKRWLAEGEKDLARQRLTELLRRFPDSKVAPEAKKLQGEIK